MPGDLLIVTPSRGRPGNMSRLLQTVHSLSRAVTHVHAGVDGDDPELPAYRRVFARHGGEHDVLETGPRMGLVAWTNKIALARAAEYRYLASFGDDHVPRTRGFDKALITAIDDMGGTGIAYPFDGIREDIPEAAVVSSGIVAALGWMGEPSLRHFYQDQVWADLGRGAGCLRFCRAIAVDHAHPSQGAAPPDATYADANPDIPADKAAWKTWRKERMAADVAVIRALRERSLQPA